MNEENDSTFRPAAIAQPEVRERILDSAENLFRTMGYLKVTVADIARDLRMSPANVYRFFDSKVTLREALVARLTGRVEDACRRAAKKSEGDADTRLLAMIEESHRMTRDLYISEANVSEILSTAIRENWIVIEHYVAAMHEIIEEIIQDGARNGTFNVKDPHRAAALVFYSLKVFIDPSDIEHLFAEDDMEQARAMGGFLLGALKSGTV